MAESGCLHTSSLNTVNADNRIICNNFKGDRVVVPESGTITDPSLYETNGEEGDILSLNEKTPILTGSSVSVSIVWPKGTYIQDMSFMIVDADSAISGPNITISNNTASPSDALFIKLDAVKGASVSGIMEDKIIAANSDTGNAKTITLYKNIPINFIKCSTGILGADQGGIIEQMSAGIDYDSENYNHSFNMMDSENVSCWTKGTTDGYPLYNPTDDTNSRDSVKITFTKALFNALATTVDFNANENKLKIMVICTFIKVDLVEIDNL